MKILFFFLLVKIKLDGHEIPNALPDHLIPPSKRHLTVNGTPTNTGAGIYPTITNTTENTTSDDG